MQANVFARDILMPATVLHSLDIKSFEDISRICNVSEQSAKIRYERLLELEKGICLTDTHLKSECITIY